MTTTQRPVVLGATQLRRVFGRFPTGVTALAAHVDGEPVGMAVSSFTSVSLDPPLVAVCIQQGSDTWRRLGDAARLGISVLSAHQAEVCRQLAAPGGARFEGVALRDRHTDAIWLDGAAAWLDCSISSRIQAGDHEIALLEVHEIDIDHAPAPLVFHNSRFAHLGEGPPSTE